MKDRADQPCPHREERRGKKRAVPKEGRNQVKETGQMFQSKGKNGEKDTGGGAGMISQKTFWLKGREGVEGLGGEQSETTLVYQSVPANERGKKVGARPRALWRERKTKHKKEPRNNSSIQKTTKGIGGRKEGYSRS